MSSESIDFVAIDFEAANGQRDSACAVGVVVVKGGLIIDRYYSLIRPPGNEYHWGCIRVHGIHPEDTESAPEFKEIYPELERRLKEQVVVAHNARYDRGVLKACMTRADLDYSSLGIEEKWECTEQIYREKGFKPSGLRACCAELEIKLEHHQALSDANACAELFLRK